MSVFEPRWDLAPEFGRDLAYGEQGEHLVAALLAGGVEVKRKRYRDLKFYVETSDDRNRRDDYTPSGIQRSEAERYAFVISDTGIVVFVPAARLRRAIELGWGSHVEERDGDCPTRGTLLSLNQLLSEHLE